MSADRWPPVERPNVSYGDHDLALGNEILRSLVGSGVHGLAIDGTDDRDEMGVFIEPPEYVIGGRGPYDTHSWRTQPEGARSGPGDIDLTVYSLRKYLKLALRGNPTILLPLFAPADVLVVTTPLGEELRALAPAIVSRRAPRRFLGYLTQQEERLLGGGKRNRVPARPELIAAHGYDTKYASHAIRLGLQGVELAATGRLTLPMDAGAAEQCLWVKRGEASLEEAVAAVQSSRRALEWIIEQGSSPLPETPDWDRVDGWAISVHRRHWGWS